MTFAASDPSDRRLPTVSVIVRIVDVDGHSRSGRIFVPTASRFRSGPPSIEEWLEEDAAFFAFQRVSEEKPVLLNKDDIAVLSVDTEEDPLPGGHALTIECGTATVRGYARVHTPSGDTRVIDELNSPARFLVVSEGRTRHAVRKRAIRCVREEIKDRGFGTGSYVRSGHLRPVR